MKDGLVIKAAARIGIEEVVNRLRRFFREELDLDDARSGVQLNDRIDRLRWAFFAGWLCRRRGIRGFWRAFGLNVRLACRSFGLRATPGQPAGDCQRHQS